MFQSTLAPRLGKLTLATSLAIAVTACGGGGGGGSTTAAQAGADAISVADVVTQNADIAFASYSDSVTTAMALDAALETFVADPTDANMEAARQAWLDSRIPYLQTEVYRFRDGPIDALNVETGELDGDGPEGRINGWPLGEALIDYVAELGGDDNMFIDGDAGMAPGGISLIQNFAATTIDMDLLINNFEVSSEADVTTGYHAIEFLLWGQDTNEDSPNLWVTGNRDASGGQRPVSDYSNVPGECTNGQGVLAADIICQRRGQYLLTASELLIRDLTAVRDAWDPEGDGNHYQDFVAGGNTSLALILEGMGRLSAGELAGERITIALLNDSQEDEHSCFADNTHVDIFYDALGVQNSYLGTYTTIAGEVMDGPGVNDLVEAVNPTTNTQLIAELEATQAASQVIVDTVVDGGLPFDNQLQDAASQPAINDVITSLVAQVISIEDAISDLQLTTNDLRQDTTEQQIFE